MRRLLIALACALGLLLGPAGPAGAADGDHANCNGVEHSSGTLSGPQIAGFAQQSAGAVGQLVSQLASTDCGTR
jgi:hypothetical protein